MLDGRNRSTTIPKTPSAVGLVNELFRRQPGVQRSLHPYNTLAARGPLAAELLRQS